MTKMPPNKPMKLTVACGARSLSARRWAVGRCGRWVARALRLPLLPWWGFMEP